MSVNVTRTGCLFKFLSSSDVGAPSDVEVVLPGSAQPSTSCLQYSARSSKSKTATARVEMIDVTQHSPNETDDVDGLTLFTTFA